MSLKDKTIVVTGGSRGSAWDWSRHWSPTGERDGRRPRIRCARIRHNRLGVAVIPADVTDKEAAQRILAEMRPDIVVLNAGATPRMGRWTR